MGYFEDSFAAKMSEEDSILRKMAVIRKVKGTDNPQYRRLTAQLAKVAASRKDAASRLVRFYTSK